MKTLAAVMLGALLFGAGFLSGRVHYELRVMPAHVSNSSGVDEQTTVLVRVNMYDGTMCVVGRGSAAIGGTWTGSCQP
jgi:hypothetical protein